MNLYVSNLNYKVADQDLRALFSQFGEVASAKVITDKFTGQSRGFGFVEMPNESEGNQALDALNGTELEGRSISVNEARPREERPRSNFGGGGGDRGGYGGGNSRGGNGGGYNKRY